MAEPPDRVQVLKRETAALGGSAEDEQPWDAPIEPQEDAIEAAGVYFQDVANRDEQVLTWREGGDMKFKDVSNPSGYTLAQLATGGVGLGYAIITTEGGLVYDTSGNIVIKDVP